MFERKAIGYDLHITRAIDGTETETAPIPLEEWVACVRADPEMHLDEQVEATGYAELKTPDGKTIRWKSEGVASWTGSSLFGLKKHTAWFRHNEGEIIVKNPDKKTVKKMCAIAIALKAQVQGDEGEVYN